MRIIEHRGNEVDLCPHCEQNEKLHYSVVISSKGRPGVLGDTVRSLFRQVHLPERIIVVLDEPSDAADLPEGERVQVVCFAGGNSAKRNLGMDFAPATLLDYLP